MAKDGLRFLGDPDSSVNWTDNTLDKSLSNYNHINYMLDRTNLMFKHKGLPDTIPEHIFEYMLQTYGVIVVIEHEQQLYALRARLGGWPDPYYRDTTAIISNPALNIFKTYRIVNHLPPFNYEEWVSLPPCVAIYNDTQMLGLLPMFIRYASQLTENNISIRSAQINSRQHTAIIADTGPDIESANAYVESLEAGELATIARRPFMDGINVVNGLSSQSNSITQLIELDQYIKASFFNEIGLNSNINTKREYVSKGELYNYNEGIIPLIDNMLKCREMGWEEVDKLFSTSISVEKNSVWIDGINKEADLINSTLNSFTNVKRDNTVGEGKEGSNISED